MEVPVLTAGRQPFARQSSLTEPEPPEVVPSRQPPARAGAPADVADAVGRQVRTSAAWTGPATGTRWPVLAMLALQSPPTVRLIRSMTASFDEPLDLSAGRPELAHLIHDRPVPHFATYVPGARTVYPLVSAVAVGTGGLCAAGLVSLAMMPGAAAALHGIARRLFARRAAFLAAAPFAGLSRTQFLGAVAAHDAVALALLAMATWLAVLLASRAGRQADAPAAAAAAVLALATAAKYASALLPPVVLSVAVLAAWRGRGAVAVARTGAIITGGLTALLALGPLGGAGYRRGVGSATLQRRAGAYSGPPHPLPLGGQWLWAVALFAALGAPATVTSRSGHQFALLVGVLAAAVLLAAAEPARIHTSLVKPVDHGGWLGCAAASHAVAALPSVVPAIKAATAFRAAEGPAVLPAMPTASRECGWPVATARPTAMRQVMAAHRDPILSDNGDDRLHFFRRRHAAGMPIDGTFYIGYSGPGDTHPRTDVAGYADAIRHGYFCVILPELVDNLYLDAQIERFVSLSARYRLINSIPHAAPGGPRDYLIWLGMSPQ
jgi:hypothetical protein